MLYYNTIIIYMLNFLKKTLLSFIIILFSYLSSSKAEIQVVTSIKPLHSLASMIMQGVGEPKLIVDGNTSPHNFSLKPSHAKILQTADIVFWIGEDIETFLEKSLSSLSKKAKVIELMQISQIKKLKFREKNIFEVSHDDHGHKKHDDHGHKKHDDHGHAHGEFDPHIWLDPMNAKIILKEMTKELILLDKKNASKYKANLRNAHIKIDKLVMDINFKINKSAKYIVFHDAYQYFENRFGLKTLGALTVNTDILPGAEQLKNIRNLIKKEKAKCIFSEPQFNPKIIKAIAKDTNIKTGVFDPLGADLKNNEDLYLKLIINLSNSLKNC